MLLVHIGGIKNKKVTQRGIFITFEGVEGSGKTTQAQRLATALGSNVLLTREPGGTPIAERIRDLFLTSEGITPMTELLLIAAARTQHVEEQIRPALQAKRTVICDRFIDATVAYQGYRGGIDLALIHQLNRTATGGLTPDITFILDLPPEVGLSRQQQGGAHRDRLDRESLELHRKVREGYLSVARANSHRVKLIDAAESPDVVHAAVLAEYQDYVW